MRIVINNDFGGFCLSRKALERLADRGHPLAVKELKQTKRQKTEQKTEYESCCRDIERNDPMLLQVVDELGEEAAGSYCVLDVVEIPDDVDWEICTNDGGLEWVGEKHRRWWGRNIWEEADKNEEN